MNNKEITVILLLYNTPENLIKNLKNYTKFKILILDQSNDIKLKKKIQNKFHNIEFYKVRDRNEGFSKGINYLIKKVKTKYFLCTQPDILFKNKSIQELKKTIAKNKNCVVAIPKIEGVKNYIKNKKDKNNIILANHFIGAIFIADTKKFMKLGMFDENFFFYWEDIDLSNRINKSKYNIKINLDLKAIHQSGTSSKKNFYSIYLRNSNFKFGEYFFHYKNKKLKFIKMLREPLSFFLYLIFNFLTLNIKRGVVYFCFLIGIFKFYFFIFKKILRNNG
tara:strand:- start:274 stop:1107 length:834 start_codon:yes stop_codon:yes gene_type:complete